jgi:hypothetical protein
MKRTITFFVFILTIAASLQAQQSTGDTIFGRNPRYFYGWWSDEWFALDTTIMFPDTTYAVRSYDPVSGAVVIDTIADSVSRLIYHSAYHETRMLGIFNNTNRFPGEWVQLRHTDSALCIIGLAGAVHISEERDPYKTDCDISDTANRLDDYLLLCKELPDTFVCIRRVRWSMETPARLMEIPTSERGNACCIRNRFTDWSWIREYYFDIPVTVTGDFYVGGTFYNNLQSEPCFSYYESLVTGCMNDSCPSMIFPGKQRNIGYYNDQWYDYYVPDDRQYMLVFPIIGSMCPEVTDLSVTQSSSDSLLIEWGTDWHQANWELQYYPTGTSPDSAETIVCHSPSYLLTGLDSTITYNVRVRAVCTYDSTYRSEWQRIAVHNGMTVGIHNAATTPDDSITLRPNPASKQVTVSATMPLRKVEVYDLAGRLVEARQPSGNTLQLDLKSYPSGTYLVKITTGTGTSTKKLVVK